MKSPTVLLHTNQQEITRDVLARDHEGLTFYGCDTYEGLPKALEEHQPEVVYSLRFNGTPGFPREALLSNQSVKWIAIAGSGTDHMAPWKRADNTPLFIGIFRF